MTVAKAASSRRNGLCRRGMLTAGWKGKPVSKTSAFLVVLGCLLLAALQVPLAARESAAPFASSQGVDATSLWARPVFTLPQVSHPAAAELHSHGSVPGSDAGTEVRRAPPPAVSPNGGSRPATAKLTADDSGNRSVAAPANGTCSILVVADDWDYASPTEGGLPYYTSALDVLGLDYDVWDTESPLGDPPQFSDMAPYDVVIWFTGYAWGYGVFTNLDEFYAGLYLDAGGDLILSSQDYYYEADTITPFMEDYLGIATIHDDVVITATVGIEGDPVGDGLGPYALVRPDDWDAYWPPVPPEGPLDDTVFARNVPEAAEPFRFDSPTNTTPNSTRFDGGLFKSVYLGWPFEWVDTVDERAEILGSMLHWMDCDPLLALTPSHLSGSGIPGANLPYTLTITNNMGEDEAFALTYDAAWPTEGPQSVGPIADGTAQSFVVTVTVPLEAGCYEVGTAVVTATALTDPLIFDSAAIQSQAEPAGVGGLEGSVYDANASTGIDHALVRLALAGNLHEVYADSSGYYSIASLPACDYGGQYSAMGYRQADLPVAISEGNTTSLDVFLDAPLPTLSAEAVSVSVPEGGSATGAVTILNDGSADLNLSVLEQAIQARGSLGALLLRPGAERGGYQGSIDPKVYTELARSGTGTLIAYMADQADLSAAFGIRDRSARGYYVLNTLRATAERSQAALLAELDAAGSEYESRYIVNAVVFRGDLGLVERVASRPDVAFIGPNRAVMPPELGTALPGERPGQWGGELMLPSVEAQDISWGITKTHAISAWEEFDALGQGIVVASIDTGVSYHHEALIRRYRGRLGGGIYDHNYDWWDPYGNDPAEPYDGGNRGTSVMGAVLGNTNPNDPFAATYLLGMAPGAKWFTCQGFSNRGAGPAYDAELMECAEFVLAPWDLNGANPDPDLRADVVNNSWGSGQAQWWYGQAINAWQAAGMLPVFAAGDGGDACGTVASPADLVDALGVGASDVLDNVIVASSRGPAYLTGFVKPNVTAPGRALLVATSDGSYAYREGSSLAAPHVTGQVAQLWSAVPELRGDAALTSWIVQQSAIPLTTDQECGGIPGDGIPNNTAGWGRIDALEALRLAGDAPWDIPWLEVQPVSAVVLPGESVDLTLAFDADGLPAGEEYGGSIVLEFNDPYVLRATLTVTLTVRCIELTDMAVTGPTELLPGETGVYSATWQPITATMPVQIEWSNGDSGRATTYSWVEPGPYTVSATGSNCGGAATVADSLDVVVIEEEIEFSLDLPLVLSGY